MSTLPSLRPACALGMAELRGWQRKAEAVGVDGGGEAGSFHRPTLQMHPILCIRPRKFLGGRLKHSCAYIPSVAIPLLSKKLPYVGAVSEHCIWLDPASWSCHLH